MNNNVNKKLQSILSGLSPNELQSLMRLTKGSGMAGRLSQSDKQRILDEFSKLDANQVRKKLASLNSGELSKLSADEIVKRLRQL